MNNDSTASRALDDLPDGRNGHVVGENDDNILESIGKAIVAPIAGADESIAGQPGPASGDPARPLPQDPAAT